MTRAINFAQGDGIDVEVLGAGFYDDLPAVKEPLRRTTPLSRSILDVGTFDPPLRLPLIADLLAIAQQDGTGEYVIYTNVDISPHPYFYCAVDRILRTSRAYAHVINRRTIPARYRSEVELPLMYSELGESHTGFDCFVFPRDWIRRMQLGNVCIGTAWIGVAMIANLDALSGFCCQIHKSLHLTFHLGDDRTWVKRSAYIEHNRRETAAALDIIAKQHPPAPRRSLFAKYHAEVYGRRPPTKTVAGRMARLLGRA